jgi:GNAT superfamily N-acetyltransferase
MPPANLTVRPLSAEAARAKVSGLARILIDAVDGGASVGFLAPLAVSKAEAFFHAVADRVAAGQCRLFVAEDGAGALLGTVQLAFAQQENQPHRAEISKMLVLRAARRQGLGAALMRAAETAARQAGRTVLVLDTATDEAERLYTRLGWILVGSVPGYALLPDGQLCDTKFFYKTLS